MSYNNTEIGVTQNGLSYNSRAFGKYAGQPTVELDLSKSDKKKRKISSLKSQMERWGWTSKLQSGFARLKIGGNDPLADEHAEALEAFHEIVSPRFMDIEVGQTHITQPPLRVVNNVVDSYTVFVPEDREFDEEAFRHISEMSTNFGNVEFHFRIDKWGYEEYIQEISREYKMYDSDIYLYPVGRKVHTVADNFEICEKVAKSNSWNISPRLDIFRDYEDEGTEDDAEY